MVRLMALSVLLVLVGCTAKESKPRPVEPVTVQEGLFPVPYFPAHETQIEGLAIAVLSQDWSSATQYAETQLNEQQKAWMATLEPAGGEGQVGVGFTGDFDGDGTVEKVSYGAYTKTSGTQGNFVLVTRQPTSEVLLLKELPGPPQFTVFTLKPDGSLWFGGGIDAGEVTMRLTWEDHQPVFSFLGSE